MIYDVNRCLFLLFTYARGFYLYIETKRLLGLFVWLSPPVRFRGKSIRVSGCVRHPSFCSCIFFHLRASFTPHGARSSLPSPSRSHITKVPIREKPLDRQDGAKQDRKTGHTQAQMTHRKQPHVVSVYVVPPAAEDAPNGQFSQGLRRSASISRRHTSGELLAEVARKRFVCLWAITNPPSTMTGCIRKPFRVVNRSDTLSGQNIYPPPPPNAQNNAYHTQHN